MSLTECSSKVQIREYEKKDIDYIINRHRELYDTEYGFSSEFGEYVAKYVNKFDESHDKEKEKIWIVEENGKQIGVIAVVKGEDNKTAQLRWFLLEPEARGKGLGHKLVDTVIEFSKANNYKHIYLWTVNILGAARHIYKSHGFELTEEIDNSSWTKELIKEERWDLEL